MTDVQDATVRVGVLGPVVVEGSPPLPGRDRVVLSALVVTMGTVCPPDRLAAALYGDDPPATWRKVVQGAIARLRRVLGAAAIETTDVGYRLALADDEVDLRRFERLVDRSRTFLGSGDGDRALATAEAALDLFRGDPLAELDGWPPGRAEAARLSELRSLAEEDLVEALLLMGRPQEAAAHGERQVRESPLRERRWARLAVAHYRSGRQGQALRTLHEARSVLVEELGLEPGEELRRIEQMILEQSPDLQSDGAAFVEPSTWCPYRGLSAYGVDDGELFFGRRRETDECLKRLRELGFLAIVGPSGSGKSSLARAGIVATLTAAGTRVAVMTPGIEPMRALRAADAEHGSTALLLVDQLEELFTQCRDVSERDEFAAAIDARAAATPVIVTLRADHIGEVTGLGALADRIERAMFLLGPLEGDELRAAIVDPARHVGLRLEPGLVELAMRDVAGRPGSLPMLSHALTATWEHREGSVLTTAGYEAGGGVNGAVAATAERVVAGLSPTGRRSARNLLLRLVSVNASNEAVRRRIERGDVPDDSESSQVLDALVRSRLVTADESTMEITHEAMVRAWPRLQNWLVEDREGQATMDHLARAASGWAASGGDEAELYRGARLQRALEWQRESAPTLTTVEREFLERSLEHHRSEQDQLVAEAARQRRVNRRLRLLAVAIAAALVVATGAAVVAIVQRERAREQRRLAQAQEDLAAARELAAAADASLAVDPERTVLLALAAIERTGSTSDAVVPEAVEALHRGLTSSRVVYPVFGMGGSVDWSPSGTEIAAEGPAGAGTVELIDAASGAKIRTIEAHDGDVTGVAFNHDGTLLATTGSDGVATVWRTATGARVYELRGRGEVRSPQFSTDGSRFAAVWPRDDTVGVADAATGANRRDLSIADPIDASFDPSGARLVVASSNEPTATVVDVGSGTSLLTLRGFVPFGSIAWSPDGSRIAATGADSSTRVFDAESGAQMAALSGDGEFSSMVDWSPDGGRLVTANGDGTADVWFLAVGDQRRLMTLSAYDTARGMLSAAFSPDGTRVVTGTNGNDVTRIWDVLLSAGAEVGTLAGTAYHYSEVLFSPDGASLFGAGGQGALAVWDSETLERAESLGARDGGSPPPRVSSIGTDADLFRLAVRPDGQLVAAVREESSIRNRTAGVRRSVEVWEVGAQQLAFEVPVGTWIEDVAWSGDGAVLAIVGGDGDHAVVVVADSTGREITRRELSDTVVWSVRFDRAGHLVMATGRFSRAAADSERVEIWDWNDDRLVHSFVISASTAVPSPADDRFATTPNNDVSANGSAAIWDATTGALVTPLGGVTTNLSEPAFSPDGSLVAAGGDDGVITVWDAATGARVASLDGHYASVSSVAFHPDGTHLVSTGPDGVIRIWTLDLDELIAIAHERLTRGLTDDECRQYLHLERCAT